MNNSKLLLSAHRIIVGLLTSTLLANCAIQPSIEDVTPLDIPSVVRKIRCEARQTIKKKAVELIESDDLADDRTKTDAINIVENDSKRWKEIPFQKFDRRLVSLVRKYDGALVFFDFTFTISEENNISSDINLLSTLTRGSNALNLKASNNRSRQNLINFRVQDSFAALLTAKINCSEMSRGSDYMYPITGEIGLYRVISDFIDINETTALVLKNNVPLSATTLKFVTAFAGSASPKLVLSPIGKPLSLADAAFTAEIKRSDQHEVLIGLSLPESEIAPIRTDELGTEVSRKRSIARNLIAANPAQAGALNYYMDQQISRSLITNLGAQRLPSISLFP